MMEVVLPSETYSILMTASVFDFKETLPQISITSGVQETNVFKLNSSPEKKFE